MKNVGTSTKIKLGQQKQSYIARKIMKSKKIRCDIYTRVSTNMQVDGYSLDAQKEKLKRYAEFQNMGISAIAAWLNQHGYKKKKRQNNTLDAFASSFIKGVLDNPVYCGKLAYGRRKNEKVSGTRNEYRIVKQENCMLHDGIHEGIISETDWELAHQKREKQV